LLLISSVNSFFLWGRFTGVGPNGQVTVDHNGLVNTNTGFVTPISTNYIYVGSSATIDGISALDNTNGVFYYTTDGSTKDIYSVQLASGTLNPPIDVYASVIAGLQFDNGAQQLIIGFLDQTNKQYVMFYPVDGKSTITMFASPPSIPLTNAAAYNYRTKIYYNSASTPSVNQTIITAFQVPGGQSKQYIFNNCSVGYVIDLFLDANSNLLGMGEAFIGNKLLYYFVQFDLNKLVCTPTLLPTTGIVTATTFSPPDNTMFFNEAINGGDLIRMYFPSNGTITKVNCQQVIEDLNVQY